jgi:hypothetical protein
MVKAPKLYQKYYLDKQDERLELFTMLQQEFALASALYAGSFVHIAPSFVIPRVIYLDNDKRLKRFFADPEVKAYIEARKTYTQGSSFMAYQQDYAVPVPIEEGSVDALFSFFAGSASSGPISRACKSYLKPGGILITTNSHGDASLASLDLDYQLEAVLLWDSEGIRLSRKDLGTYFQKKDSSPIDGQK